MSQPEINPATAYAQPVPLSPHEERQMGALAHGLCAGAMFFSGGTLGFVAALVMYALYKDRGPFVRAHVTNALNLQISIGIGLIVSAILMLALVGFVTYPFIWVGGIVLHIIGAVKASSGQWWTPPLTPRILS